MKKFCPSIFSLLFLLTYQATTYESVSSLIGINTTKKWWFITSQFLWLNRTWMTTDFIGLVWARIDFKEKQIRSVGSVFEVIWRSDHIVDSWKHYNMPLLFLFLFTKKIVPMNPNPSEIWLLKIELLQKCIEKEHCVRKASILLEPISLWARLLIWRKIVSCFSSNKMNLAIFWKD